MFARPVLIMLSAMPGNISACIDSLTCEGTQPQDPVGEVTGYWLFACSVSTAKVNRWASHLFTPSPASDKESHGTESRSRHGQRFGLLTVRKNVLIAYVALSNWIFQTQHWCHFARTNRKETLKLQQLILTFIKCFFKGKYVDLSY